MTLRFVVAAVFALTSEGASLQARAKRREGASSVALVSGVSAKEEMCLASAGGRLALEACANAVRLGDGREIWNFQSGGKLVHAVAKTCVGPAGPQQPGVGVSDVPCDAAPVWEATAQGQLKVGSLCLSGAGAAPGVEDGALRAAIAATSTFDAATHGAWAAVDGNGATYWASKAGEIGDVQLVVDLGSARPVDNVRIAWEFPARAFAVQLSVDGGRWEELFQTSVNVARETVVAVGGRSASKLRVVMREALPEPIGANLYGVRSISVMAPRMLPVLEDCSVAAKSTDARDKYFLVSVGSYDGSGLQAARAALPAMEAAEASLSGAVAALVDVMPKVATCAGHKSSVGLVSASSSSTEQLRGDLRSASELLARAREIIVGVRQRLL